MTVVTINATGCVTTRSEITGDIICRWPGEWCDCLVQGIDGTYAAYVATEESAYPMTEEGEAAADYDYEARRDAEAGLR